MAELVAGGAENTEIARRLGVSPSTVTNALTTVYRVLHFSPGKNHRVLLVRLVLGHRDMREE